MKRLLLIIFAATLALAQMTPTATVNLSWSASTTQGLSKYNVYRSNTAGGPYTLVGNSGTAATLAFTQAFTFTASQQNYFYVVRALASDGTTESVNSNERKVTISPLQPNAVNLNCMISISPSGAVSGTCQ